MLRVYIAFDPGGTTGFAAGFHRDTVDFELIDSRTINWNDRYVVYDLIIEYGSKGQVVVIAEDFMPVLGAYSALVGKHVVASEVLGMIDLACAHVPTPLIRQAPFLRKSVQVLDKHADKVGTVSHRISAYQHLRYRIIHDVKRAGQKKKR